VTVFEFGAESRKNMVIFQCAAEPWWAFNDSAEAMARNYHVFLMIADGHDETGTDFISLEKYASDAASYPETKGCKSRNDRSFNTKKQLIRLIAFPFAAALLAWIMLRIGG